MVILNISNVPDNPCNGVSNIVPQIVNWQNKCDAESALVNICGKLSGCDFQFEYKNNFEINKLPEPFNKPDIVVFHEVYKKQYPKIAKEIEKLQIPFVIIPHGSLTKEAQSKKKIKKTIGNILLFNSFTANAIAYQCVSEEERKTTKNKRNIFVGGFGINPAKNKKTDFRDNTIKLIYIGRLEVNIKGLDILIEAIGKSAEYMRIKGATLKIFGPDIKGRYSQVEELINKYNVKDIVLLNHEVFGEEKEKLLLDSDIFIQASRSEGLPLGILEALNYGIPCIVTEGTGFASLVNKYDAGIGVKTNSDEIAEAIKNIDRLKLKKQSQNARRLIEENYSWEALTKNTINKYEELIKKGNN